MRPDAEGKLPYLGSFDCAMKTLKAGGPFKFYTGFSVYCVRIARHVMMTWIFLNQIQRAEKKIGLSLLLKRYIIRSELSYIRYNIFTLLY
ncbi:hypothetical protein P3S67_019672 [Capsicum chacoense]